MPLTPEQKALRKGKVMASDVAAYLCLSPYQGPLSAWAQNMGLDEQPENEAMQAGNFLEDGLIKWAAHRLGHTRHVSFPGTVFHPMHQWAGCTPDAAIGGTTLVGLDGGPFVPGIPFQDGIQIKVHNLAMAAQFSGHPEDRDPPHNNLIPAHHLVQCQWEMFVTGARVWWLGAYFGGADFRLYRLHRDDELIDMLKDRAHDFWRRYLDPAGPLETPPASGYEADRDVLARLHPEPKAPLLAPNDRQFELARRLLEVRGKLDELAVAKLEAENQLKQSIGDHDGLDGICTWKLTRPKPKPDFESIARLHPDFEDLSALHRITPEPYRVFRFTFNPAKEG